MPAKNRIHDSYWRGVRRLARKEARQTLFGSTERAAIDTVGWVAWLIVVFFVLRNSTLELGQELAIGIFAGASPALIYPIVYWYKRAFIPPRLRTRAQKRVAALRAIVARIEAGQRSVDQKRASRTALGVFLQRGTDLMGRCAKMVLSDYPAAEAADWESEVEEYLRTTFDESYVARFKSGGSVRTISGVIEAHRRLWSQLDARTARLHEFLAETK